MKILIMGANEGIDEAGTGLVTTKVEGHFDIPRDDVATAIGLCLTQELGLYRIIELVSGSRPLAEALHRLG